MSLDQAGIARQYRFDAGPNYTDSILTLAETELAESSNMLLDGGVKTIPGAARLSADIMGGSDPTVTGLFQFGRKDGTQYFIAAGQSGRMAYQSGAVWAYLSTTLATTANTFWDWTVFNNTLIATSGTNAVQSWDTTTFGNLAGSPPQSRFVTLHGADYVFLAGHTSNPSQIRYSDADTAVSWPVGNTLQVGLDDGQIITGLQKFGDSTIVFKERSIYIISGATAADFSINPTLSEVGCIAPNSIVSTDVGVFFWSEGGPAVFNGFKTILLNRRMRRILDEVDWDSSLKICAGYYPYRKQVLVSYQRSGQTAPDRMLVLDLYRLGDDKAPAVFWPLAFGATAMAGAEDSVGRKRVYFGHANGYVTAWDSGTIFNGQAIPYRVRSKVFNLGRLDREQGMRTIDLWFGGTASTVAVKYSVNGGTFTAHGSSPITLTGAMTADASRSSLCFKRLPGDGNAALVRARTIQLELSGSSTAISLQGWEVGFEPFSKGAGTA